MAATLTGEKVVMGHTTKSGEVRYALFEKTCDANVFPRELTWSCLLYGTIEQVLQFIETGSQFAEGRMIKSENGRALTADRYTQLWHTALAKPFALPGVTYAFEQKVFEDSFSSKAIDAPGILRQHGFEADAAQLERLDIVALSLFEHGEALDAMCHANGKYNSLFICRTLPRPTGQELPDPGLAYHGGQKSFW